MPRLGNTSRAPRSWPRTISIFIPGIMNDLFSGNFLMCFSCGIIERPWNSILPVHRLASDEIVIDCFPPFIPLDPHPDLVSVPANGVQVKIAPFGIDQPL